MSGLLIGEWSCPFCSQPRVGRLMGPKPVVDDHQTGFSPDDWKHLKLNYSNLYLYAMLDTKLFIVISCVEHGHK